MVNCKSSCLLAALAATLLAPSTVWSDANGVVWRTNFDAAKLEAAETNRLLLVHFWATTCAPCRVLDQTVFNQPHVAAALERDYVPIKVDVDGAPALQRAFRITQWPTDVVINPQGEVVAKLSCPQSAEAYLGQLQTLARHYRQTSMIGGSAAAGADAPPLNAAYANLPIAHRPLQGAPPRAAGRLRRLRARRARRGWASTPWRSRLRPSHKPIPT